MKDTGHTILAYSVMYPLFKGYISEYTQYTLMGYRIHSRIHTRYIVGYTYGIRIGCTKKGLFTLHVLEEYMGYRIHGIHREIQHWDT